MKLKIEYIPIGELTPYSGNAKTHPAEQIEQIKRSIEEFGFNDPIAVWGSDNTIVEGHGRLIAGMELGIEKVPIIRLDELTDEQRRAYTLAHNKLTMNSNFDFNLLQMELQEISEINMEEFGFNSVDDYIDNFFDEEQSTGAHAEEVYEDHEITAETHTKRQYEMLKAFCKKQNIEITEFEDVGR